MDWYALLYSVLGGLAGGLFTYLGVIMTIRYEERKREEDKKEQIIKERPRLKIVDYVGFGEEPPTETCNLEIAALQVKNYKRDKGRCTFSYSKNANDDKNYDSIYYKFVNEGQTEIKYITLVSNDSLKRISCIPLRHKHIYIKEKMFSPFVDSDEEFIARNQNFTLKISFLKDEMPFNLGTATFSLCIVDVNDNYWVQPLFSPERTIGDSDIINYKEYREYINLDNVFDIYDGKSQGR